MRNTILRKFQVYLIVIFFFINCNEKEKPPEVKQLITLNKTTFAATLEEPIANDKNVVYAPSFLYAWKEIKSILTPPVTVNKKFNFLHAIDQSKSYENSLPKDEIDIETELDGDKISARAFFKRSLPFREELTKFSSPLNFKGSNVESFGYHGSEVINYQPAVVSYYKNDYNFIIELFPKDTSEVIILYKFPQKKYKSLMEIVRSASSKMEAGFEEAQLPKHFWKYSIGEEDLLQIPIISFNLETNFSKIEGSIITTRNGDYMIETAYQRTAFLLDEKGAEIESESTIEAVTEEEEEAPSPKKLVFDKSFLVIVKKKKLPNPYLVLLIHNEELLKR